MAQRVVTLCDDNRDGRLDARELGLDGPQIVAALAKKGQSTLSVADLRDGFERVEGTNYRAQRHMIDAEHSAIAAEFAVREAKELRAPVSSWNTAMIVTGSGAGAAAAATVAAALLGSGVGAFLLGFLGVLLLVACISSFAERNSARSDADEKDAYAKDMRSCVGLEVRFAIEEAAKGPEAALAPPASSGIAMRSQRA
jgi:hypothetical protein